MVSVGGFPAFDCRAHIGFFLALSFFFDLGLSIYYFLFNLFLMGHGFDEKALGLLTSATAVGNLVGALPSGKLARRFGLRPVLFACFTLAVIVSSARALLLSLSIQLVLAFMAGIILSAWAVCLSPAVAQLTQEKQRPRAFSLLFSLGIGMGAIGGFVGSRLPYFLARYPIHFALEPPQIVLLISCTIVAMGLWPFNQTSLHPYSGTAVKYPLLCSISISFAFPSGNGCLEFGDWILLSARKRLSGKGRPSLVTPDRRCIFTVSDRTGRCGVISPASLSEMGVVSRNTFHSTRCRHYASSAELDHSSKICNGVLHLFLLLSVDE